MYEASLAELGCVSLYCFFSFEPGEHSFNPLTLAAAHPNFPIVVVVSFVTRGIVVGPVVDFLQEGRLGDPADRTYEGGVDENLLCRVIEWRDEALGCGSCWEVFLRVDAVQVFVVDGAPAGPVDAARGERVFEDNAEFAEVGEAPAHCGDGGECFKGNMPFFDAAGYPRESLPDVLRIAMVALHSVVQLLKDDRLIGSA